MSSVKPIDKDLILDSAKNTGGIITVEEHSIIGGLGDAVADVLIENDISDVQLKKMGIKNRFVSDYGTQEYLRSIEGIAKENIITEAENICKCRK